MPGALPTTTSDPDDRLMRRLRLGDADAFALLYRRYYGIALAVARRYVHDDVAAEDVAQECFLSLWRNRSLYRSEHGSARTWLLSITHNRAIDATRRAKVRPRATAGLEEADRTAARDDVAAEAENRDCLRRTRAAIAGLPPAQREVIGLSCYVGLTHEQIAARTGTPLGTVKGRSRLAMVKLRGELAC